MKARMLVLLLPFLVGCATATEVATTVGVGTGMITSEQKQAIDRTAVKAEKAARPITEMEEYYIGRGVAARILSRDELYNHPETIGYVNHIGNTLAINSSRPCTYNGYHFAVLDTDEINAFACPGGIIFITRGMLKFVHNEDELAGVLAHENRPRHSKTWAESHQQGQVDGSRHHPGHRGSKGIYGRSIGQSGKPL